MEPLKQFFFYVFMGICIVCIGLKTIFWGKIEGDEKNSLLKSFFKWYPLELRYEAGISTRKKQFMSISNVINLIWWPSVSLFIVMWYELYLLFTV